MTELKDKPEEKKKDRLQELLDTKQLTPGVPKRRWLQMGAELEGSWDISRADVAAQVRGAKSVVDASVKIGHGDPGEIITRPHANLDQLCEDIRALYPNHVHVSCGFHLHNSFTPMDASVIASRDFYTYFKDQWEVWGKKEKLPKNHEFWHRLMGQNKNARDEFNPEKQLQGDGRGNGGKGGQARYTILNFMAWEIHRTIECRLLPMFSDKEVAIRAVRHLAWIYDSYLEHHGFTAIKYTPATELRGERAIERYSMRMPDVTPAKFEAKGQFPYLEKGEGVYYSISGAMDDMMPFKTNSDKQTP